MKKILLVTLFIIIMCNIVYSAPPFIQEVEEFGNLQIEFPIYNEYEYGTDIRLHFHVLNSTGMLQTNVTTFCMFHLSNRTQEHLVETNLDFDDNGYDFEITLNKSLFKLNNFYQVLTQCNNTNEGGIVSFGFKVIDFDTMNQDNDMTLSIVITFIIIFIGFVLLGFLNEELKTRFFCFAMAFIQIIILYGVMYGKYIGKDISGLLGLNLTVLLILGFGIGMISMFIYTVNQLNWQKEEKSKDDKWGKKWGK